MKFVGGSDTGPTQGVLHIRTPALMTGYYNRGADTRKRLIDGWYDTGDVMRRDENGFAFFVGRADDMFQCGGETSIRRGGKLMGGIPTWRGLRRAVPDGQVPASVAVVPKPGRRRARRVATFRLDNARLRPSASDRSSPTDVAGTTRSTADLVERAAPLQPGPRGPVMIIRCDQESA